MHNGRTCTGDFTLSGDLDIDLTRAKQQLDRMRNESKEIPEDPFQVIPSLNSPTYLVPLEVVNVP